MASAEMVICKKLEKAGQNGDASTEDVLLNKKNHGICRDGDDQNGKTTRLLEGARGEVIPGTMAERGREEQERTRTTATSSPPLVWEARIALCKVPTRRKVQVKMPICPFALQSTEPQRDQGLQEGVQGCVRMTAG
jgi:hypothetical protein